MIYALKDLIEADFKYIDGILNKWYQNDIKTLEDIALKDKNKNSSNNKQFNNNYNNTNFNKQKAIRFNDFTQRDYDYDSLEKKLLGWDNDD